MIQPEMAQKTNEIVQQARQGSMAALIQLMNEQLTDVGVRTRAMFSDGILQILCEAATVEQLEQSQLVERIQTLLEGLSLPNFRRIRINARIAREQQLLWLEEITRDPENQLLWMQEIAIKPPNLLQRLKQQFQESGEGSSKVPKVKPSLPRSRTSKRSYWQGLLGGAIGSFLLVGAGFGIFYWRDRTSTPTNLAVTLTPIPVSTTVTSPATDSFANAIRMAEDASQKGQQANTVVQWLALATQWQQASDLMATVPPQDPRYPIAQERVILYQENSEMAQKQAERQKNIKD